MRPLAVALTLLVVLGGCDLSGDEPAARSALPSGKAGRGIHSYEGRVIRGWLLALDRLDYDQAAYYFAPGALIDQGHPYRLRSETEAREFNATLPCRADLASLVDEGRTVLAAFRLRAGPGGPCSGTVEVRYTIRDGKFTEWHQLERPERGPGAPI